MVDRSYEVRVTPRANYGVIDIVEYIRLDSPQNAEAVGHKLFDMMDSLERLPNRFSAYLPLASQSRNFRSVAVWDYIIVYEVIEKEGVVNIHDVFHGVQDK